jgi:Ssp1 endopeptidase immunity protein Rap1a
MRPRWLIAGAALLATGVILAPPVRAPATVTESQFPPTTVRDLIAICAADKDDPRMTAAVNFCHGFVEGAVVVEEANESQKGAHRLFCLPSPRPPRGSELTNFIAWANEQPARLDMPSIDGMFIYLAQRFPCPEEAATTRRAR